MPLPPDTRPFVGRTHELEVLEDLHASGRPELFVLYGRRRVGKTELLQRFCERRRAVYFLAAQVRDKDNLNAFRECLREGLDDPLLDSIDFPDWSSALNFAAERAGDERLVIVLDEFPYLCEGNKGLPSLLQRFWDSRGKRSQLMVVLCGSQVSFMEREVLAERSPLFGRRTGQRRLEPLRPADSLRFFDGWELEDRITAYAILGGMPAYLQRFDPARDLRENLLREILRPEGYLFDEVQFLLHSEMTTPATYNSILRAVAKGSEKVGDIALTVGVESTTANKYLSVLRELGLVERLVPMTDPDPLRSRRGTYRIADRFLAFHFRHVQPNLSLIEAGRGERVLEEVIEPDIPNLFEDALVDFVLDHLRREAAELLGREVLEVGRHGGERVRALARLDDGSHVAAVVESGRPAAAGAEAAELTALSEAFGEPPPVLRYRLGNDVRTPLVVEGPELLS
ncbi:ATP-binding protein [Engelhardtia mirabilis]|uniref:Archaeal ATPase n=1 Tax=Engelhardtia mirabilis TaxID=2528011 RepID=A0A518BF73_9BACT|nr:Archaeal ATPase [Planctomycetes bacterium Pla133]QDU99960.1 Archaeal ATPase [Planctomycetes bacterium Pla86]